MLVYKTQAQSKGTNENTNEPKHMGAISIGGIDHRGARTHRRVLVVHRGRSGQLTKWWDASWLGNAPRHIAGERGMEGWFE